MNGKAGKFLDEERRLGDYPFNGPVGYLEVRNRILFLLFLVKSFFLICDCSRIVQESIVLIPFIIVIGREDNVNMFISVGRLQSVLVTCGSECTAKASRFSNGRVK